MGTGWPNVAGAMVLSDAIWSVAPVCQRQCSLDSRPSVKYMIAIPRTTWPASRDQGYDGPPFRWDEEDRLRRRARLDALSFHLYGLDREAADYVLGTFPIVRREEEARWGRFRSRDLILGYMAALAAGAPDAAVAG